jgi:DNA polymerase III epsilon subunit-like protein
LIGEDLKDDYVDKFNYSTFDGEVAVPIDAELNKEYLIKNGINEINSAESSRTSANSITVNLTTGDGFNNQVTPVVYNIFKHTAVTHTYFNPKRAVDEGAFSVHGLSNEFLLNERSFLLCIKLLFEYISSFEIPKLGAETFYYCLIF